MAEEKKLTGGAALAAGQQYPWVVSLVAGAAVRGLRSVLYEEQRRSRDRVLLALGRMREILMEEGMQVKWAHVARVLDDQLDWDMDPSLLTTEFIRAGQREAARSEDPLNLVEGVLDEINARRREENGR
jgi:hypothetical protein